MDYQHNRRDTQQMAPTSSIYNIWTFLGSILGTTAIILIIMYFLLQRSNSQSDAKFDALEHQRYLDREQQRFIDKGISDGFRLSPSGVWIKGPRGPNNR
jgi:hypothetical protein